MKNATIFTLLLLIGGCKKENNFCGYKDPVNEIQWLYECTTDPYAKHCIIYEATYNNIDGFLVMTYYDSSYHNALGGFGDCQGNKLCNFGGITGPTCADYDEKESYRELIYSR